MSDTLTIEGHDIKLSHSEKVFFPQENITKGDVVDYYSRISDAMLPYLKDRPLVMHRYPDGIDGEGFIQQKISDYFPDWVARVEVQKEGGTITHVVCQDKATLVYLADQACIAPHVWLSRREKLDSPDMMIFDLDPPGDDFEPVRKAAFAIRDFLSDLGASVFVKTTGSRGLHVVVPLDAGSDYDTTRKFAQSVARILVRKHPNELTTEQRKDQRKGRVFLDYLRNSYGQTAVAAYSLRAKTGAPVSMPVTWQELEDKNIDSRSWTLKNVFDRLSDKGDAFESLWDNPASISEMSQKLNSSP